MDMISHFPRIIVDSNLIFQITLPSIPQLRCPRRQKLLRKNRRQLNQRCLNTGQQKFPNKNISRLEDLDVFS